MESTTEGAPAAATELAEKTDGRRKDSGNVSNLRIQFFCLKVAFRGRDTAIGSEQGHHKN